MPQTQGRVARGAAGADPLRRLYRRSPARWLLKILWDHRGLRHNDVFVASYPRSGSSWLRFLLYEMAVGEASFERISRAVPYVGKHQAAPPLLPDGGRLIKTHEPYLRRYRRAIHLVRDPRDVALSYFQFMQRIQKLVIRPTDDERASLDAFIGALLDGRVDAHGTWESHLLSWSDPDAQRASDILRVRYEDLRADPAAGVQRIAEWLGMPLTASDAERVAERCSIERMREAERYSIERMREAERYARSNTPSVFSAEALASGVPLINAGRVARWRVALTPEQRNRFAAFNRGLTLMGYKPA